MGARWSNSERHDDACCDLMSVADGFASLAFQSFNPQLWLKAASLLLWIQGASQLRPTSRL